MTGKDSHLSDQDLLLAADGELSARRDGQVRQHLQACWACRKRMADLELTIADFVGAYESDLDRQLPPENGGDAILRRRLTAAASSGRAASGLFLWRGWAMASFALLVVLLLLAGTARNWRSQRNADLDGGVIPNPSLTPGEASSASRGDVCQAQAPTENVHVPDDLKEAVFKEYGMKDARRDAYEVDFLITPELGGSASMRNLWPEPYERKAWNAHVKDKLEDRLHLLVCSGDLDLATAQREIASNWVSAYKKYVGLRHPI